MKNRNNENLIELLVQFFDADQASKAAADMAAGERIFAANPAPTPSPELLANIKRQMTATAHRKRRRTSLFARWIAAAAVILCVLGIGSIMLQRHGSQSASESFWQETADNNLEAQLAQFEQPDLDSPVITLEANGNDMSAMNDLTDELDEIEGTFWEG